MDLLGYDEAMACELTAMYNRATAGVPHCYPVSQSELADAFGAAASGHGDPYAASNVVVARESGRLMGFVHAAAEAPDKDAKRQPMAAIRFLWYERHRRVAGAALLEAAEAFLRRELPGAPVHAFWQSQRYPFLGFHSCFLSDRLDHVGALLQGQGYRKAGGEVFLDWPDYPVREPVPVDRVLEFDVQWEDGRGQRPGVTLTARFQGNGVGQCVIRSCGEYSRSSAVQDWAFIDWLGVREAHQGIGLGKHLLQRALNEMRDAGYRHAAISTAWTNHRAFVLYAHFGFQVADWTYGFERAAPD